MSLNGHYNPQVRAYLLALQSGNKPDSRPDIPEYWQPSVERAESSYSRSGGNPVVVRKVLADFGKLFPDLPELLATERPSTPPARGGDTFGMPELPEFVRPNEKLAAQASPTLDAMIAYIRYWATRSYEGYHEAAALWVLSTIAARRIVLPWRDGIWPTLYFLFASDSGQVAKTEAANYGASIIRACDLSFFLAPDEITPQRLVNKMAGRTVPRNYSTMDWQEKEFFRLQTAFAAQKGWLYDEFGDFLQEIINGKSQNAGFYRLLKRLYDNKAEFRYDTISRGEEYLKLPSLSIIGTTVPDSLMPMSSKSKFWTDGQAGRIAFIAPPADYMRLKSAPPGKAIVPEAIVQKLTSWHERLGIPPCQIIDVAEREELMALAHGEENKKKKLPTEPYIIERGDLPQHDIYWTDSGVREAHEAYFEALMHLKVEHNLDKRFSSNYNRFPDMALKIAMLLASLENDDKMDMRHWYRGQQITERWRRDLHCLMSQLDAGGSSRDASYGKLEDRVQDVLLHRLAPGQKASARQIMLWGNTLLRDAGSPEVRKILENLVDEQQVEKEGQGKTALYGLKQIEASPLQG